MKIGSFMPLRSVWDERIEALALEFPEHEFFHGLKPDSPEAVELDILIAGRLPGHAYLSSSRLKVIFQPFTGINHLPLQSLAERGVRVFNVHANAFDVAERALALTLAFYGRVVEFHDDLRQEKWHGFWVRAGAEDNWDSIAGRTCAILGTGAIGVELAKLLKAFSCPVIGWRRKSGQDVPEGFDKICFDLDEALGEAEIIFVALPATALTEGLLSKERLLAMKGKFLVNVGRGSIVDEEGLYEALRQGVLKGAAIDTWYQYPPSGKIGAPSRFPIHTLQNIILSPHVGGATHQASARAVGITIDKIRQYLRSGECGTEADLKAAY
ncbi:MAG: D-isomer specific 2-hydroxyacid dehydrogenase [Spirochaetes bacterium]|nr:MAG: D-isomer specific 2-hydroxyacid dehydrogenase [Spirochaetota bacterium]